MPQHREVTLQEGLTIFNDFMRNVTDAVIESEILPERKFRNLVAGVSRTIPIFLQSEREEYGMTLQIYDSLMAYRKAKPARFQSMMTLGNFSLEGSTSYLSRKVIISIPDGKSKIRSHVTPMFVEVIAHAETEAIVGVKRKAGERGPSKKDFSSARTAAVVSQNLTKNTSDIIKEYFKSNFFKQYCKNLSNQ
jgi:phenylacetate-coenzyme A ligase PaaK-like adenylate-forming protein